MSGSPEPPAQEDEQCDPINTRTTVLVCGASVPRPTVEEVDMAGDAELETFLEVFFQAVKHA